MTTWTDLCRRPNGELVTVEAPPFAQVRFNGAAVNVPKGLLHVRGAASDKRMVAIGTQQNSTPNTPDHAFVCNDLGHPRVLCQSHGNQACAIVYTPIADVLFVAVVESETTWRRMVLSPQSLMTLSDSGSIPYPPDAPPHSSQGFRDITGDGWPIWYDDKLAPDVHDGLSFFRYLTRGSWTAGIVGRKNRVGLWDGTRAWISFATTQVQPRLEVDPHGHPYVAVSTDGGGHVLTLADFTGYAVPPKADLAPIARPFLTGAFAFKDAKAYPGQVVIPIRASAGYKQWLIDNRIQVIAPSDDHAWVPKDLLYGIYTGEDAGHGLTFGQAVTDARTVADGRGVGLFAFSEADHPIDAELALIRPQDAYLQKAFLKHGETDESLALRLKAAKRVLQDKQIWTVLVVGCHQRRDDANPTGLPVRPLCEVPIVCSELVEAEWPFGAISFRLWPESLPPAQRDHVVEAVAFADAWYDTATALPPRLTAPTLDPKPEPKPQPTPDPIPDPAPVPEEPVMPYIGKPIQLIDFKVTEEPRDHGFVALKKPNGKYLGVDSGGNFHERNEAHGGDEVFLPDGNVYVCPDRGGKTFVIGRFGA